MPAFNDLPKRLLVACLCIGIAVPFLYMGGLYAAGFLTFIWIGLGVELFWASRKADVGAKWEVRLLGVLLLLFTLPVITGISLRPPFAWHTFLLWIVPLVVLTDSGAYFGGRLWGGPRMAPKLSPGKTWSGFVIGMFCGISWSYICLYNWAPSVLRTSWLPFICLLCPLAAVCGDLAISGFKRRLGIKDFGALLPGHGGLWDRLDGFLGVLFLMVIVIALSCGGMVAGKALAPYVAFDYSIPYIFLLFAFL